MAQVRMLFPLTNETRTEPWKSTNVRQVDPAYVVAKPIDTTAEQRIEELTQATEAEYGKRHELLHDLNGRTGVWSKHDRRMGEIQIDQCAMTG